MQRSRRLIWLCVVAFGCGREPSAPHTSVIRSWQLPASVAAVDLARDGQALLLGSETGESSLWNAPWNLSVTFDPAPGKLLAASFAGDGQIVLARDTGMVELRSGSGAVIQEMRIPLSGNASRARVSSSGRFAAFDARVFDLATARPIAEAPAPANQTALQFAGDRFILVTSRDDGGATALALGGSHPRRLQTGGEVSAGTISSDGRFIAAGTPGGLVIWDGDRSDPSCERSTGEEVAALAFSLSGSWLGVMSGHELLVFDVKRCRLRSALQLRNSGRSLDVDDDLVAAGDAGGVVYVWDTFNERLLARAAVLSGEVTRLRLHAGTRAVLAGTNHAHGAKVVLLRVGDQ